MSVNELSIRFFLQIAVILGVCRFVAWIARSVGQSVVVSEMIAGVFLGPSLFGLLAPRVQEFVFPKASMPILFSVCQVGLALYMFTVGLEFDVSLIQKRMRSAAAVSIAGMATPFLLGMILAWYLIRNQPGEIFSPRTSLGEALMFMGASMSITAFPMLARIIYERGLSGTSLGTLALAAGSMDDAGAWCVLAVVLASFSGDPRFAALAIGGGVAYAAVTLTLGRRLLAKLGPIVERAGRLNADMLTLVLTIVMIAAWFTDYIRIYAVFGAFVMGIAMPRGKLASELKRALGPVVTTLLLPLFFVYSGLNTRIGLVNSWSAIVVTIVICAAATLGKGVACWGAARLMGEPPREALAIGALMNSRGLMELIILNIGLERGIITGSLFTMMVLMAILTTLAATPLFEWFYRPGQPSGPGHVPNALL